MVALYSLYAASLPYRLLCDFSSVGMPAWQAQLLLSVSEELSHVKIQEPASFKACSGRFLGMCCRLGHGTGHFFPEIVTKKAECVC